MAAALPRRTTARARVLLSFAFAPVCRAPERERCRFGLSRALRCALLRLMAQPVTKHAVRGRRRPSVCTVPCRTLFFPLCPLTKSGNFLPQMHLHPLVALIYSANQKRAFPHGTVQRGPRLPSTFAAALHAFMIQGLQSEHAAFFPADDGIVFSPHMESPPP